MRNLSLVVMLSTLSIAHAQPNPEPKDGKVVIPLTLSPTASPRLLSKYYLTSQYQEMQPGNRVPAYMKSYMEQASFFSKEPSELREKWNGMKLEDLPLDEIKKSGAIGGLAYRLDREAVRLDEKGRIDFASTGRPLSDVDAGSRMLTSDWQMWHELRRDGIGTLLPEVQKMRELASVLKVRMRYEIATKNFEKAAYSARTYHGLMQSFETHPSIIAGLVGIAVESICLNALEEMIQQPGCPNLYWSFTEMPAEGINLRTGIQAEKIIIETHFGDFLHAQAAMTEDQILQIQLKLVIFHALVHEGPREKATVQKRYTELAADSKKVAAARTLLLDSGMKPELVKAMPAMQAVITADLRQYEVALDDSLRIFRLPYRDAMKMNAELEADLKASTDRVISKVALPAMGKVYLAQIRLQQRISYLRVIEAIRLHAFENGGKLPAKLSDIKVPLPLDPVTGEAFRYALKDGVATLSGGNATPDRPDTNRIYEIRIRK